MAAQLPDIITLESQEMDLYTNPLEAFWEKTGKRKPHFKLSENCKRGYIAFWKIENKQLILYDIRGSRNVNTFFLGKKLVETTIKDIFPRCNNKGVLANWYSGKLRIPAGLMTQYEHYNYNSRFEKEIIITITKGVVIKMVTLDYTQQKLVVNLR
ncbi:MAG: hypothetical protein KF860_09835 [Cyclobacteriaceae bacterium]|nr:hypothetical protein [Cyclobacteriaceae bacterium]